MDPHAWINSIVGLIGVVTAVAALRSTAKRNDKFDIVKHEREMAVMGERVSVMWGAFMASGVQKGITRGALSKESPVRLCPGSAEMMDELKPALQAFRRDECPQCNEQELSMKIAARFKEQLIDICTPNHIQFEVGVLIATAIAKGTQSLTEILDAYVPTGPTE